MPFCFSIQHWYLTPPDKDSLPHLSVQAVSGAGSDLGLVDAFLTLVCSGLVLGYERSHFACPIPRHMFLGSGIYVPGRLSNVLAFLVIWTKLALYFVICSTSIIESKNRLDLIEYLYHVFY